MAAATGTFIKKFDVKWTTPPGATVGKFNKERDEVLKEFGHKWHRETLKKHFTEAGAVEYGYAKRSAKYEKKKQRMVEQRGHPTPAPLVYTGRLRSAAQAMRVVKATNKRLTVTMPAVPKYLYQTKRIDKSLELTALSENDLRECAEFIQQELTERWNNREI